MTHTHAFVFGQGAWVGEGTVSFSTSPEQLYFITKWEVDPRTKESILCRQEVRMEGADEPLENKFHIFDISNNTFKVILENPAVGQVSGKGIVDEKTIGWEFQESSELQGYEVYQMEAEDLYKFHAEYVSTDDFRTIIDGHIRRTDDTTNL